MCIKAVHLIRRDAIQSKSRLCMAFLDIKAALDTLTHQAIGDRLKELECSQYLHRHITGSQENVQTRFHIERAVSEEIPIRRGKAGHSPFLLHLRPLPPKSLGQHLPSERENAAITYLGRSPFMNTTQHESQQDIEVALVAVSTLQAVQMLNDYLLPLMLYKCTISTLTITNTRVLDVTTGSQPPTSGPNQLSILPAEPRTVKTACLRQDEFVPEPICPTPNRPDKASRLPALPHRRRDKSARGILVHGSTWRLSAEVMEVEQEFSAS